MTLRRLFNQGIEVFIDPESQEVMPTWRLGMRLIAHPMFIERVVDACFMKSDHLVCTIKSQGVTSGK